MDGDNSVVERARPLGTPYSWPLAVLRKLRAGFRAEADPRRIPIGRPLVG